jgi:glycosyltransferase involved in cell wall biosynthesis
MAVFNAGFAARQAVNSILAQSFTDFELVVVDDASTDGCLDFLEKLDEPRIRVVRNAKNVGASLARNRAVALAEAPLLAIADADDMAHPLRLEIQATFLERHPEVTLVAGATQLFGRRGRRGQLSWPVTSHEGLTLGLRYGPSFYHGSVMVRTEALRQIGGYRNILAEDYDVYSRLLVNGYRLAAVPQVVLVYRDHAGGLSKSRAAEARRMHRETSEYVRRHVQVPAARPLVHAARHEPTVQHGEPRLRMLKLLGRTAFEHGRRDPAVAARCALAALAVGPGTWARLAWSSLRTTPSADRSAGWPEADHPVGDLVG